MAVTLLVAGRPEPAGIAIERSATASATAVGEGELLANVEVVQAFDLSPAARTAASAAPAAAEVRDDDILEIQVEDGFTLWTSAARYAERSVMKMAADESRRRMRSNWDEAPSFAWMTRRCVRTVDRRTPSSPAIEAGARWCARRKATRASVGVSP